MTELIAEMVVAKKLEITGHELLKTIHPHPTMSEAIMEAAAAAYDEVCLLYTSDAADERSSVDLGGRRIIKKKKNKKYENAKINTKKKNICKDVS